MIFTQKELWILLKSLGRIRDDDSLKLIEKIKTSYTEQRLSVSEINNIPGNTGD